jgi:Mg2+-importing ATPase
VAAAAVGAALPFSPLAGPLGFTTLPADLALALAGLAVVYLALVELGKAWFYRTVRRGAPIAVPRSRRHRHVHRRATRWSRPHGSVVPRTRRRR